MELWIRSQDKKRLLKVFDVYIGGTYNSTIKANFGAHYGGCQYVELGEYKSTSRALEVLDEIQKYILLPNTDNSAYIYEMPEE